jgi:hypothetical protein
MTRGSVEKQTRCPWCRTEHELATGIDTRDGPAEGDRTLCIRCGEISVFDGKVKGGLRKPNAKEREKMLHEQLIFDLRRAWYEGVKDKPWKSTKR